MKVLEYSRWCWASFLAVCIATRRQALHVDAWHLHLCNAETTRTISRRCKSGSSGWLLTSPGSSKHDGADHALAMEVKGALIAIRTAQVYSKSPAIRSTEMRARWFSFASSRFSSFRSTIMLSALSSCRCKVCTRAVASRRAFASASAFSVIACIAAVKHAKHAPHMQPPEGRRFSAAAAGDGVSVATMPARRCSFCRRSIIVRAVSSADFCVVCSIRLPVASKPAIRAAAKSGPRRESVATVSAGWTWSFSSWTALPGSDPGVRQCLSASCRGSSVNNE